MSDLKPCPFLVRLCSMDGQIIGYTCKGECAKCPAKDAKDKEIESLKNKLALVKEHLVVHRDSALNNIREDKDQCRKVHNEFLAWFCNRLIELINTDTGKMEE